MNLGIRAFLYTARKCKKSLLLFCLLLSITTLVLSGLAIADAQEKQTEEMRGTTGASFTVERNLSTGGWSNGIGGIPALIGKFILLFYYIGWFSAKIAIRSSNCAY